jgi:glutamate racemase
MNMSAKPLLPASIGVFDSGVGGLTVLHQLQKRLPQENFVYLGDTARLPYGDKSGDTIIRYSLENAAFLMEKNVKMIVVACNTASSYALEPLQQALGVPVIGVIEPGAEQAVRVSEHGRIGVLGTKATINSGAYQKAILRRNSRANVFQVACPLFVPLVEERYTEHPAARLIVQEYLKPLKAQHVDTVLLGCTHYPLLKDLIIEEMGLGVEIVDSGASCAEKIKIVLKEWNLQAANDAIGSHSYFVSDDPLKFQAIGQQFLGMAIDKVELISFFSGKATR